MQSVSRPLGLWLRHRLREHGLLASIDVVCLVVVGKTCVAEATLPEFQGAPCKPFIIKYLHSFRCLTYSSKPCHLLPFCATPFCDLFLEPAASYQEAIGERTRCFPLRKREESLQRERVRIQKHIDRLVTAYQESLVTLEQLRQRMPDLRRQEQAVQSELLSLAEATADQSKYLRLVETLAEFRARLRVRAGSLEVGERQKILRLLVKEILMGKETITIRHSISTPHSSSGSNGQSGPLPVPPTPDLAPGYLLRSGSHNCSLRRTYGPPCP